MSSPHKSSKTNQTPPSEKKRQTRVTKKKPETPPKERPTKRTKRGKKTNGYQFNDEDETTRDSQNSSMTMQEEDNLPNTTTTTTSTYSIPNTTTSSNGSINIPNLDILVENPKLHEEFLNFVYTMRNFCTNIMQKLPPNANSTTSTLQPSSIHTLTPLISSSNPSLSSLTTTNTTTTSSTPTQWGNLLSQYAEHPNCALYGSSFSIGKTPKCDLYLKDLTTNAVVCKLRLSTNGTVTIESLVSEHLLLNNRPIRKSAKVSLRSGDEITINANRIYSYIFQQITYQTAQGTSPLNKSNTELSTSQDPNVNNSNISVSPKLNVDVSIPASMAAKSTPVVSQATERYMTRSRKRTLERTRSLTSLSPLTSSGSNLMFCPSTSSTSDIPMATELSTSSSSLSTPNTTSTNALHPNSMSCATPSPSSLGSTPSISLTPSSTPMTPSGGSPFSYSMAMSPTQLPPVYSSPASETPSTLSNHYGSSNPIHLHKMNMQNPYLPCQVAAASAASHAPSCLGSLGGLGSRVNEGFSSEISASFGGESESLLANPEAVSPLKTSSACVPTRPVSSSVSSTKIMELDAAGLKKHFHDEFRKSVIRPGELDITFDNFPYHSSEETKQILIHSAFLFLKRPDLVRYTSELSSISRRILLSGPTGTDLYQEFLVRALAHHFQTSLLIFDSSKIPLLDTTEKLNPTSNSATASSDSSNSDTERDPSEWTSPDPRGGVPSSSSGPHTPPASQICPGGTPSQPSNGGVASAIGNGMENGGAGLGKRNGGRFKKGDRVRFVGPSVSASINNVFRMHSDAARRTIVGEANGIAGNVAHRGPQVGNKGKIVLIFDDNSRKVGVRFDKPLPGGMSLGNICEENHGFFVDSIDLKLEKEPIEEADALAIEALFEVASLEELQPCILFIKSADKTILRHDRYSHFKKQIEKITSSILVIGSSISVEPKKEKTSPSIFPKSSSFLDFTILEHLTRLEERTKETSKTSKFLHKLFPNKINVFPPQEPHKFNEWKKLIDQDTKRMKSETNKYNIKKALEKNNLACDELNDPKFLSDKLYGTESVEKIIGWAISNQILTDNLPAHVDEKLVIKPSSLEFGVSMFNSTQNSFSRSLKEVEVENEFEKRLLSEVIPPNEIGVKFEDIGALDKVKETLRELVMLPLSRPELFLHGNLTKPCKGILLFGPPGTGKTMLAKSVATESKANFINVSMSSIGSKWFGEGEKCARAVFTLASKIAPSVIFIDEVDSFLGKRERVGEHEAMRKIKNEFMSLWDGLKTKENERVLVLAATNRPFDLDDAVLRRMPRRMLVDLPDFENREKILRVILAKENLEDNFQFGELAKSTDGYSGSDLKNLCISAAYTPIREILAQEKKDEQLRKEGKLNESEQGQGFALNKGPVKIRNLTLEDFERAKKEISPSVSEDAVSIAELRKWNEMYGEGGNRKPSALSYFM